MKTLNNLKLRIMVRAFRIRLNNGEAFEKIAADYSALTTDDLEAIRQLWDTEERQAFFVFSAFHAGSSSPMDICIS